LASRQIKESRHGRAVTLCDGDAAFLKHIR